MAAATSASPGWEYSVDPYAQMPSRRETFGSHHSGSGSRANSRRRPSDYAIQSDTEAVGARKQSIRASNTSTASRKRSRNALREKEANRPNVDDSAWIHRDKLAQIEIQEMEEAGIHVRQSRRSSSAGRAKRDSRSQSRSRRPASKGGAEAAMDDEEGAAEYAALDSHREGRKRVSTIPAADDEEEIDTELRTSEEVATEHLQHSYMRSPSAGRPGTSRIPVSKISPVPVPQQVVDRDSPLPRSRAGSGAWSGAWDELQYARRARSGSIGSQVLLDDAEGKASPPQSSHLRNPNENKENSPPKPKMPGGKPTSGARNTAKNTNGTTPPRPGSSDHSKRNPSAAKRPSSRSGHKSRPSTGHAPEGEAPWIASMYKPDPRLPPDQQMLPTHAKRMMQQQWEKDGKTGSAYDRDFRLLNDDDLSPQGQAGAYDKPLPSPRGERDAQWPLSPNPNNNNNNNSSGSNNNNADTKSETASLRPGTSGGIGGGGYRITPTITSPPQVQRSSTQPVAQNTTPRLPEWEEKEELGSGRGKKKGGCGCCIVM